MHADCRGRLLKAGQFPPKLSGTRRIQDVSVKLGNFFAQGFTSAVCPKMRHHRCKICTVDCQQYRRESVAL
jgi:hypothetical protein